MNKLGQYNNDERGNYSFGYYTEDGKHVNISFRAEPDYDLDIVFNEFRNFLIASGHDIEGEIGELGVDDGSYEDGPMERTQFEPKDRSMQNPTQIHQDKFSMDHLPNNGWPFGGLTTTDISAIQAPRDWGKLNQYPTMAPLTSQQIQSWSLDTKGIQALTTADLSKWRVDAPGTLGSAKVTFGDPENDWSPRSKDYQK